MAATPHDKLWHQAVSDYQQKLSAEDKEFFLKQKSNDLEKIIESLSKPSPGKAGKNQISKPAVSPESIAKIKSLTKVLTIFTTSFPEVSTTIWVGVYLLNERSNVSSETRNIFDQAIRNIASAVPHFRTYEVVFAEMGDVEASMIKFYSKVIAFLLAALDRIKSSSSWTHKLVEPAPTALLKAFQEIEDQKKVVEKEIEAANLIVQNKRHVEIKEILDQLKLQSQVESKAAIPCHMIPYSANPLFHGRQEILDKMKAHLVVSRKQRSSFAISGLGGVGKTQIALKYIHDHLDEYPVVLWMQSDTQQKLAESYTVAAKRLHLEPEGSQKDADAVTTVLKTWLSECDVDWLLVFDNADDLQALRPFWPPGNRGAIIITSRNPAATHVADSGMRISPLTPDEGETLFITLLTSRGSDHHAVGTHNKERVSDIIKQLGYLPLAIVQVSSFILECDCTLEEFQELYHSAHQSNQSISELETSSVNLFYEYSLATVWKVSILKLGMNALKLLRLMSCFDPDGVPESLLWEGSKVNGRSALRFLNSGLPYHTAVKELISRGLVIKAETGAVTGYGAAKARSLTIHRLVQETVFHQLSEEDQAQLLEDALAIVLAAWKVNEDNVFRMNAFWPTCALYLPHVLELEARCRDAPYLKPPTGFVRLFFYASWYLFERRMSEFAFPLLETARSICAQNGDKDPFFAKLMTAYGCVCMECDQLPESAGWFSQVVDIYRARYEEEQKQPDSKGEYTWLLATSLSDWGCACTGLGELERAEELFKEGLSVAKNIADKKAYKDWRVHIAHNLSRLYTERGKPEEALELQFEYGDEFADGLIVENTQRGALFLYGIGNSYLALAQKREPEGAKARAQGFEFHARALRIRQQLCGEHFVTAVSLHKIGVLLYEDGDCEGAAGALEHAISIFEKSFMATREKTRSLFYLSLVKTAMNEDVEAEKLLSSAWKYLTQIIGKDWAPEIEKDSQLFDKLVFYVYH
ncbi:hypothetical protein BGZ63DRAFT_457350 [Mariannaea sp. PMI_226]|nr:hypothetical protein BGZ63DRAFT_457350 [Mariannaea sp. PMI_226]